MGKIGGHIHPWLVKNNFPRGFQLLCMNCNFSKGTQGSCVHLNKKLNDLLKVGVL